MGAVFVEKWLVVGQTPLFVAAKGFWREIGLGDEFRIWLYAKNTAIIRDQNLPSFYEAYPPNIFNVVTNPGYWQNTHLGPGEEGFKCGELWFTPTVPTNVCGWLLMMRATDLVIAGEVLFSPRRQIKVGETLKFTPSYTLTDHGPPCPHP